MRMGVRRRYERRSYRKRYRIRHPWRTISLVCICALLYVGGTVMAQRLTKQGESQQEKAPVATEQPALQARADGQTPPAASPAATDQVAANKDKGALASDAQQDKFADALFIGDSRTEGLKLYAGLQAKFLTAKGMMVNTIFTKPAVTTADGQKITIGQAMAEGQYKRVYVMLGVNELGWVHSDQFIAHYTTFVRELKQAQPSATIYVQSILPVTRAKSQSSDVYTNEKIDDYNARIREMAQREGVQYLDVAQAVRGADGALPEEATTDGVHLNKAYCQKWADFLRQKTSR